ADVVYRMAHLGNVAEDIRADIGSTLLAELRAMGPLQQTEEIDGNARAVELTKSLPGDYSDLVMERIESTDVEFAAELKAKLFVFDDLGALDARSMQRLLREVDSKDLMVALKGAQQFVQDAMLAAMSTRAAEMLRDDMDAMAPVRIVDVEAAQGAILEVAFRLEAEGVLALPRGGSDDVV
ncbi:MAG: flagellar motor switch protein FliG, partial [Myxococcales bacterium]|nr:flagellar motor switch protein FliG [Myxococcales bacterium]